MVQYSCLIFLLLLMLPGPIVVLDAFLENNDFNITSFDADQLALFKSRRLKRACPGGLCGIGGLLRGIGEGLASLLPRPMMGGPMMEPMMESPFGPPMFRRRRKRQFGCCMCCCCCCCCGGRKRRSIEFVRNRRSQLQHFMHLSPRS